MNFEINLTENCNLDCVYCHEGRKDKKNNRIMNKDTIDQTINYIKNFISKNNIKEFDINLNGGEVFLEIDNFKYILSKIKSELLNYNYFLSCSSNGTILNEEIIYLIKSYNIGIQISLDGNEFNHNKNRKYVSGKNTYEDIKRNIDILLTNVDSNLITISYLITPETCENMYENVINIFNMGIKKININFCYDFDWNEHDLKTSKEEFTKIVYLYKDFLIKNLDYEIKIINNTLNTINSDKPYYEYNCSICSDEISILPNGDILPCGTFIMPQNEQFIIGNVKDNNYNFNYWIENYFSNQKINYQDCVGCKIIERCRPICYAVNYRIDKNLYSIPIQVCEINKIIILTTDLIAKDIFENHNEIVRKYFLKQL